MVAQLAAQLQVKQKEKERESISFEERNGLLLECKGIKEGISAVNSRMEEKKKSIVDIRRGLLENEIVKKTKMEEKESLEKEYNSILQKLNAQLERENKLFEEDISLEYTIHKMKGRLYSILVVVPSIEEPQKTAATSYKLTCDSIDVKPLGDEPSLGPIKFDCVVSSQLDLRESFSYPEYMYSFTNLTLKDSIDSEEDAKVPKEILYVVLATNNKLSKVSEYLEHVMKKIPDIFPPTAIQDAITSVSITIYAYNSSPKSMTSTSLSGPIINDSMKLVTTFIKSGNVIMKVLFKSGDKALRLVFAFINTMSTAGIDEAKSFAREAAQSRSSKRSLMKDCENIQQLLLNVRIGYLFVVCDKMKGDKAAAHLWEVVHTAQFIEENVPCTKSEVVIPPYPNSTKSAI